MAQAYPASTFVGSDYHDGSIEEARKRAADAGRRRPGRRSRCRPRRRFGGTGYDLVATFDCLHDMGDPVGAARHVREALAPDGTWLIVEPYASDDVDRQPQPGRPRLLLVLDAAVRAERQVAGRRPRARRPGR